MAGKMMRRGVLLGLLALIGVGGYYVYPIIKAKLYAENVNIMAIGEDEKAPVFIPTGSTMEDVANLLQKDGIINDKDIFKSNAAKMNYDGGNVVPGFYMVEGNWNVKKLIQELRIGRGRQEVSFRTDDVWTIEQAIGKMTKTLELDSATFVNHVLSDEVLDKYGMSKASIITLFYANKYQCDWAISAEELTELMASKYRVFWTADRKAKAKEIGLSQTDATTLASIVYRECGNKLSNEWSTVAGLYMNRIKKGMKLQADPTVKYANGLFDINRVYNKHLKIEHPYNTYHITGLPPGPISTVKESVIDAVLNYEKHNYIFMCAKPGGYSAGHNFAATSAEHSRNRNAYIAWQNANNIK